MRRSQVGVSLDSGGLPTHCNGRMSWPPRTVQPTQTVVDRGSAVSIFKKRPVYFNKTRLFRTVVFKEREVRFGTDVQLRAEQLIRPIEGCQALIVSAAPDRCGARLLRKWNIPWKIR